MSVSDRQPGGGRPYQVDPEWSRRVFARRSGEVASFLTPHLRPGMRLIDCGCGPGSITIDLARTVAPGEVIGIDIREDALTQARSLARERDVANVRFEGASVYRLPYPDASFDAAFSCAVLQHLADPVAALREIRRVLKPAGVVGIVDGSSTMVFRYPTNPLLERWDQLRALERQLTTDRPSEPLPLRRLLREAGLGRSRASASMSTEAGPPAGSAEDTRRVAEDHLLRLHGMFGERAVAQGWVTTGELEQMAAALRAWAEEPDAFYARPVFTAIGWVTE